MPLLQLSIYCICLSPSSLSAAKFYGVMPSVCRISPIPIQLCPPRSCSRARFLFLSLRSVLILGRRLQHPLDFLLHNILSSMLMFPQNCRSFNLIYSSTFGFSSHPPFPALSTRAKWGGESSYGAGTAPGGEKYRGVCQNASCNDEHALEWRKLMQKR
jgi:hypothetical protein